MRQKRLRVMLQQVDIDCAQHILKTKLLGGSRADAIRYCLLQAPSSDSAPRGSGVSVEQLMESVKDKLYQAQTVKEPLGMTAFCLTDTGKVREAVEKVMKSYKLDKMSEAIRFSVRLVAAHERFNLKGRI